jgi:hypothetical protein
MKKIARILALSFLVSLAVSPMFAQVSVGISVRIGPPPLPVYVQPACPEDGYLWQPGYWAYDDNDGYYWVPGVWVAPPDPGLYWTPPYWGYTGGFYGFHTGYWGPEVGFYGGINYGYGYGGYGYGGGRWSGDHFRYNTAVVNVNRTVIHNTYVDRTVIRNTYVNNHTSFNGPGGVNVRPRPQEMAAMRERHIPPTANQLSHQQAARSDRGQFASVNHGRPVAAAMSRPGGRAFTPQGHVASPAAFHNNSAHQVGNPANTQRSQFSRPQTQSHQQQQNNIQQARPQQQRQMQQPSQQPQQRMQQAPQQQQRQQRMQQQRMQQAPQQQRMQQQQQMQQPRQQQQQRMQQQPQMQQPRQQQRMQQAPPQQRMQQQPQPQQRPPGGGGGGGGHEHHR